MALPGPLPPPLPSPMQLDHLNQRPSAAFMTRFYDVSVPGLSGLEPQELVNCAWAAVSCSSVHPNAW